MLTPPPPAPRPVPIAALGWNAGFLLLFGGIWAAVGLLVAGLFTALGGPVWNDWILDDRGVLAQAEALGARPTRTRVNRRTLYELRYRFSDGSGKTWTATSDTTSPSLIGAAEARSPLAIEYDPESPKRTRLRGESASVMGAAVFLPLGAGLVGTLLVAIGLVGALRVRGLYRRGQAAQARVTAVEATASRQNRRAVMRMRYCFQTPEGTVEGSWKTAHPQPAGATIWVLFDPASPARNLPAVT